MQQSHESEAFRRPSRQDWERVTRAKRTGHSDRERFPLYEEYVRQYGIGRSNHLADKYWNNPEKRPWWPMRYFMGDWILAAWVYRIEHRQRCEVGLFLAEDHSLYVKDSGVIGGLISLLTQTFHLIGKMEVHFVGPERGETAILDSGYEPDVPSSIRRVAEALGVRFAPGARVISDAQGRELYARLTGFSHETIDQFRQRGIDLTRACFVVQRDIWSLGHVEYLLRHAPVPERLFAGGASPADRLAYLGDQLVLRTALLEERFRIVLERFTGGDGPKKIAATWASGSRVRYTSDRDLGLRPAGHPPVWVKAGVTFEVTSAPRAAQGYVALHADDARPAPDGRPRFLAVTRDVEWAGLSPATNVFYLPTHDTLSELDAEIDLRLVQAVSTRGELSERHQ